MFPNWCIWVPVAIGIVVVAGVTLGVEHAFMAIAHVLEHLGR
jgi:hypothetical protein